MKREIKNVGLDSNLVVKVKIYVAKKRMSIKSWCEKVLSAAMQKGE